MKRKPVVFFSLLTLSIIVLAACTLQAPTLSLGDLQTQAALFAQATLTKAAVISQAAATATSGAASPTTQPTEMPTATATPTAASVPPSPTPTATQVKVIPTVMITPIVPTNTQVSPTATQSSANADIRLSFATGKTNVYTEGSLGGNATQRYVFWAAKGQLIDISVSSAQNLVISIVSAKGEVLLNANKGYSAYRDYLPSSGDWYVDVRAGNTAASYSLYLVIPQRVTFAPNTYGITLTGKVPGGRVHNLIAWANKGQTLKVNVSPADALAISIYHVNGNVLLSSMGSLSSFEGVLPEAGDYIINVISPASSTEVAFSVTIEIR